MQVTDFTLTGMDGMILVDLQKAFDPLDHTVLLLKIKCSHVKELVIKLFQSYLSNRKFFVTLEDAGLKDSGVPQGS